MILRQKSIDNKAAATELLKLKLLAPSIHCLYYSLLQISKRLIYEDGTNYVEQSKIIGDLQTDTHNWIINTVSCLAIDEANCRRDFIELKKLRKKADYSNKIITENEAKEAIGYMINVCKYLNIAS